MSADHKVGIIAMLCMLLFLFGVQWCTVKYNYYRFTTDCISNLAKMEEVPHGVACLQP